MAVDFDGTIAEKRPDLDLSRTRPRPGAREGLTAFRDAGLRVVVWTAREDPEEIGAWLRAHALPFDFVNRNPGQRDTRKIDALVYVDDRAQDANLPWPEIAARVLQRVRAERGKALLVNLVVKGHKVRQSFVGYKDVERNTERAQAELEALLRASGYPLLRLDDLGLGELEAALHRPGGVSLLAPVKGEKRAREKVETDYRGDWSRLLDAYRGSVAVDTLGELARARAAVVEGLLRRSAGENVFAREPKDRFARPLGNGYRDVLCNYVLPCGAVCEVQYHLKPILLAREKERAAYDVVRGIKAAAADKGRDLTDEEKDVCRRVARNARRLYRQAYEECLAAGAFAKGPRPFVRKGDMQGKPCTPGHTAERDRCIPAEGGAGAGSGKTPQKPADVPAGAGEVPNLLNALRDSPMRVKLPSGETVWLDDVRHQSGLGVSGFFGLVRQDPNDKNSPPSGKRVPLPDAWVRAWVEADKKRRSAVKPAPASPAKPAPTAAVKPVEPVKPTTPPKNEPLAQVTNKPRPDRVPKKPAESRPTKSGDLVKDHLAKCKAKGLTPVEMRAIPKFKRDKDTGKYLKRDGKKIPVYVDEKDAKGRKTGRKVQAKERRLYVDGKEAPADYQKYAGLIQPGDTHVHVNPKQSPALRMLGPKSQFDLTIVAKAKTNREVLTSKRFVNLNRAADAIARGDDVKLRNRFEKDSKVKDAYTRDNANLAWLISEMATRPGSDADNKGVAKFFGKPLDASQVKVEHLKNPKGEKRYTKEGEPVLMASVSLPGHGQQFRIKGDAARLLAGKIKRREKLGDTAYWLKSYGASTLEGRHVVVDKKGGVSLQFMGKETQWHNHQVTDASLAAMLKERKAKVGDAGKLFGGTDETGLRKYMAGVGVKDGKGRHYTPKNLRTFWATKTAQQEIENTRRPPRNKKEFKDMQKEIALKVCRRLGNGVGMTLKNYIAYSVWTDWKENAGVEETLTYER